MRVLDLVRPYRDGLAMIVDETPPNVDIRRYLVVSDDISYRRAEVDPAGPIKPDTLVLMVAGPDRSQHADSAVVGSLLGRLLVGARVILFFAWDPDQVPYHRYLDALTANRCQVIQVASIDMSSIRSAAVIERVDDVRPPRSIAGDVIATETSDDAGRRGLQLRMANEHRFSEFTARHLRARLREQETGTPLNREATAYRIKLERDVQEREAKIAKLKSKVEDLEGSTSLKVGRTIVGSVRSPKAFLRLPLDLLRLWRTRGQ